MWQLLIILENKVKDGHEDGVGAPLSQMTYVYNVLFYSLYMFDNFLFSFQYYL